MSLISKMHRIVASLFLFVFLTSGCQSESIASDENLKMPFAAATPEGKSKTQKKRVKIAAVGDMMIGSPFPTTDRMPPNDGRDMFKLVTPTLSSADIAFGNLEGSLLDSGMSSKCRKGSRNCYAFRMPTRYGVYFKEAGFDVLSAANNHAGDFGEAGRASTRRVLDSLGIKHAGSNSDPHSTAYLDVNGNTLAFVGFATNGVSLNVNDLAAATAAVRAADRKADIVIVSFHAGAEGSDHQNVPQRTEVFFGEQRGNLPLFSRAVIDAGADLVIGHGPHVLRGMEFYKDRLIAYSLGNFATYGWFRLEGPTRLTAILEVDLDVDGSFAGGRVHSGKQIDWGVPSLDSSGEAIRKIRSLSVTDFGRNAPIIADDGTITQR